MAKIYRLNQKRLSFKGGLKMQASLVKVAEPEKLSCLSSARQIVQKTMKERGLSSQQVRQSFAELRYEKPKP